MPQASSFTNKIRAYTEARNNKVEYPSGIANFNQLDALTCPPSLKWVSLKYMSLPQMCVSK